MAKTKVYSTLGNPVEFRLYEKLNEGESRALKYTKTITIDGGAGVAYSDKDRSIKDRDVVVTEVENADLEQLKTLSGFKRQIDAGYFTIASAPKVPKKDKSAQMSKSAVQKAAPDIEITTGKSKEIAE